MNNASKTVYMCIGKVIHLYTRAQPLFSREGQMYKLGVYVPASHLEPLKAALFAAGAGRIGNYDSCCWQTPGQGQFRALEGSAPYLGQQGKVEIVEEYRVELVFDEGLLTQVIAALRAAHPYEEPAFDVVKLVTLP
ncbi:MAG: hypothetical protein ACTS5Y_12660 [Pollutimonas bauzanensis]